MRSAKSDAGTPSVRRMRVQHELESDVVARDHRLVLQRHALGDPGQVLLRLLPAKLAHDAVGETRAWRAPRRRCPGSRRTASSSCCARMRARASRTRTSRSARTRRGRASRARRLRCRPPCPRPAAAAATCGRACWARVSGGRTKDAAARTRAPPRGRLAHLRPSGCGSPYMRSKLTLPKIMSAASAARRASSSSCTRPSARSCAGSKLCTPSDRRLTPAAKNPANFCRSNVPGFASSVISAPGMMRQPCADAAEQAVDRVGGEDARRSAADEHADDLAAPHERQRALEILQQRVDVLRLGDLAARLVRVEVAVRALAHAPRNVHVQRKWRQDGELRLSGIGDVAIIAVARSVRASPCRDARARSCARAAVPPPSCPSRYPRSAGRIRSRRCRAAPRRCGRASGPPR